MRTFGILVLGHGPGDSAATPSIPGMDSSPFLPWHSCLLHTVTYCASSNTMFSLCELSQNSSSYSSVLLAVGDMPLM